MAGLRKSRKGPVRSSDEPFREKSGTISKRLVCVQLAAKWFSFFDNEKNISLVMNFPDEGIPNKEDIDSWKQRVDELKGITYPHYSLVTCLAEDTANESSTSSAPPPDPLVIHIDGQDVNTENPDQRPQFLTDTYSALVNLVDHMHTRHLSEIENAECKLCLAYLVLSLNRLAEQPVKTTVSGGLEAKTSWRDVSGVGMLHEDHSVKWLSGFVASAKRIISDNKIKQVSIGADGLWKDYNGDRSFYLKQRQKTTAYTSMLPALDRIRMTLEDKISPALGYVQCNQILIPEKRSGQDLWPAKLCAAKFIRLQDLALHLAKFHDVPSVKKYARHNDCIYHCALCIGEKQDIVHRLHSLIDHLKDEHEKDALACPYPKCPYRYLGITAFKSHVWLCKKKTAVPIPCSSKLCPEVFNLSDDFRKHMLNEHKYFYCGCTERFDSEDIYLLHRQTCEGKKTPAKESSGSSPSAKRKKNDHPSGLETS